MTQKTSQVNVRIEGSLKAAGDAAFTATGCSPSQAVRWLWSFAAAHAHDGGLERMLASNPEIAQVAEMPPQRTPEEKLAGFAAMREKISSYYEGCPQEIIDELSSIPDDELLEEALWERYSERGLV